MAKGPEGFSTVEKGWLWEPASLPWLGPGGTKGRPEPTATSLPLKAVSCGAGILQNKGQGLRETCCALAALACGPRVEQRLPQVPLWPQTSDLSFPRTGE